MSRIATVDQLAARPQEPEATCAELRANAAGTELYLDALRRAGQDCYADRTAADVYTDFAAANRRAEAEPSEARRDAEALVAATRPTG